MHVTLGLSLEQADKIFVSSAQMVRERCAVPRSIPPLFFSATPAHPRIYCLLAPLSPSLPLPAPSQVRGFNRKGKDFYRFQTNLTEEIRLLRVAEQSVWTAGDYAVSHFVNNEEATFLMAKDRINDMEVVSVTREKERNIVLACQDQLLRMMEGNATYYEAPVEGVPSALQCRGVSNGEAEMLFGTQSGLVSQIFLARDQIRKGWSARSNKRTGAVHAIDTCFDFNRDGKRGVLVGRDDGSLEVYGLDEHGLPMLIFQKGLGESINSVACGSVVAPHAEDCCVETYSGKIISFENRADGGGGEGASGVGAASPAAPAQAGEGHESALKRLRALQAELEALKVKVEAERKAFQAASDAVIQPTTNRINDKLILDAAEGNHLLVMETPTPISVVALQADVAVELPDQDGGVAIMSRLPPDADNPMLAVFRCQDSINRVQILMRLTEGLGGSLTAYIIPRMAPKSGTSLTYRIKPLCLHARAQAGPDDERRPMSELRITGGFSLLEIHTWVGGCLPDVAARPPVEDAVALTYRSALLGSLLQARYRAGECRFLSDSVSALSILRDAITREATARKARISLAFEPRPEALGHVLRLVHPLLEYQHGLTQQVRLLEALRELKVNDSDGTLGGVLSPEYAAILANGEKIERDFKQAPRRLEALRQVVRDLFVDWYRFKGQNVRSRLSTLEQLLKAYEYEPVLTFLETAAAGA